MIPSPSRRSFLKGSSLFAAALMLAASARAQDRQKDPPKQDPPKEAPPKEEERRRGPKTDEEIFAEQEKANQKELLDDEGREYRICPQCGYRMYRQGRVWTCSNCGYNYVE
ncbi:MAG: twin-arginine translocation signal domain-containing protein [Vicinamibacteria bacterium]